MTSTSDGLPRLARCRTCDDEGVLVVTTGETARSERCLCARGECDRCSPTERGWTLGLVSSHYDREDWDDQSTIGRRLAEVEALRRTREGGMRWYVEMRACRCASLGKRIALHCRAGIPASHALTTVRGYRDPLTETQRKTRDACTTWLHAFRPGVRGVLLWGEPGTGKTHLVTALVRHLTLGRGVETRYVEASQIVELVREAGFRGKPLADLAVVPVLALDDLGRSALDVREKGAIEDLISARYRASLTTIVGTNLHPEAKAKDDRECFDAALGTRLSSRLGAIASWHRVDGADRRRSPRMQGG